MERNGKKFHQKFITKQQNNVCRNSRTVKEVPKREIGVNPKIKFFWIGWTLTDQLNGQNVPNKLKEDVESNVEKDG